MFAIISHPFFFFRFLACFPSLIFVVFFFFVCEALHSPHRLTTASFSWVHSRKMLSLRHFRTINYVCVFPLHVCAVLYHSVRSHCAHCARCINVGVVYGVHWRHRLKNNEFSHFSEKINKYFWMNWINKDYNTIHHFHLRNLCLLFIFLDIFCLFALWKSVLRQILLI